MLDGLGSDPHPETLRGAGSRILTSTASGYCLAKHLTKHVLF